jgi:hypothetical protein
MPATPPSREASEALHLGVDGRHDDRVRRQQCSDVHVVFALWGFHCSSSTKCSSFVLHFARVHNIAAREEADMASETDTTDPFLTELSSLQSAARWLVAASAAVAATLLAGVQITALRDLANQGPVPLYTAGAAGALAVLAVGTIVVMATRVLVAPGWTLNTLGHRELEAGPTQWKPTWLRTGLESQRGVLVPGGELKLSELYRQQHALATANFDLHDQGEIQLPANLTHSAGGTEIYRASSTEDVARLQRRLDNVLVAATRVANAANLITTRRRYRHLIRTLPWSGVVLVVGITAFVLATSSTAPPISTPIPVEIRFSDDPAAIKDAGLPPECRGLTLDAVAIGGTLEEPSVVSTSNDGCLLQNQQITPDSGIAVPKPAL